MIIGKILKESGIQVCGEAEKGEVAIEKYKEISPDFATLDLTLPDMNGIDVIKEIIALRSKCENCRVLSYGTADNW